MRRLPVVLALAAILAPNPRGQGSDVNINITITISVDRESARPADRPGRPADVRAPIGPGLAPDADFAGASRMYLRGIPLGLRQVAGKVGTDVKTMDELRDGLEAARKRASNGLARRLARRWVGCFDSSGNITNPRPIIDSLDEAAEAMEAGLR